MHIFVFLGYAIFHKLWLLVKIDYKMVYALLYREEHMPSRASRSKVHDANETKNLLIHAAHYHMQGLDL